MSRPRNSGKSTVKVPLQFDYAETVEELAKPLIAQYHTHLVNASIAFIYRNKPMKSKGRIIFATARACGQFMKDLLKISGGKEYDFVITVNYEEWGKLTDEQKRAVIDHELCHCWVDEDDAGNVKYTLLPHSLQEFSEVVDRYGTDVFEDLRRFCELAHNKISKKAYKAEPKELSSAKTYTVDAGDLLED